MRLLAIAACALLVAACGQDIAPRPTETETLPAVGVRGDRLTLGPNLWWPAGLNAYQLATRWDLNVGCGAEVDLDEYFASLPPLSLTRFDAFQSHAMHRVGGTVDFSALDEVVATAERHRQYVVPVLAPQDSTCDAGGYKEVDWYVDGWRDALPGHALSYDEWAHELVERWASSPTIAMWELIGEPETARCTEDACELEDRVCAVDGAQILRDWIDDAGRIVRDLDPDRPITVGTIGGDQCGTAGDDFDLVTDSDFVDVVQYHDYDDGLHLDERLAATDKPLVVAELGVEAGSCGSLDARAAEIDTTLDEYRTAGATGALLWAYVPDPRLDECTYDIGPHDPVHTVLRRHDTIG